VAFPETIRGAAKLAERDLLEAEVTGDGVVILGPVTTVDRSQAGFWQAEQRGVQQAASGKGETLQAVRSSSPRFSSPSRAHAACARTRPFRQGWRGAVRPRLAFAQHHRTGPDAVIGRSIRPVWTRSNEVSVIPSSLTIETFFTAYAANDRDGIASVLA
jgi:hypothetical protein